MSTGGYTTSGGTTMFLTDDNRIFVSGYNNSGQLGNGTTTNSNMPIMIEGIPKDKKITHIASGGGITSFVLNNRELYSAGYGGTGALGTGATANLNKHTLIKTFDCDIKQVKHYASVASEAFSAILLTDGTVYTCGYNASGQLGKNHTANSAWYGRICCEEKIKEIGLSYRGLHMLNYDGEIIVYGNNDKHQLGTSVTNTVTYNYQYAVFFAERVLKSSYQKPDEDFIQIL